MAANFFYKQGEREIGPVDGEQLRELARSGSLSPQDRVRRSNSQTWVAASSVAGLFTAAAGAPAPPPLPPGAAAAAAPPPQPGSRTTPPVSPDGAPTAESVGARFARTVLPWLKVAGRETLLVVRATCAQLLRLVGVGRGAWQVKQLENDLQKAKLNLGRKMAETGVGDRDLLGRVHQLNDSILSVEAAKGSTKRFEQERTGLFIRLADSVMGKDVPASVSHEFAAVIHAQSALLSSTEQQGTARSRLLPPPGPERWRVAAGSGAALLALCVSLLPLFSGDDATNGRSNGRSDHGSDEEAPDEPDEAVEIAQTAGHHIRPRDSAQQDAESETPQVVHDDPSTGEESAEELLKQAHDAEEPSRADLAQAQKVLQQGKAHIANADEAGGGDTFESEYRAAVAAFGKAIGLAPQLTDAYLERGHALYFLGDYAGAIRDLTVAVELDPQLAEAWCWRALAYADSGENDKAISDADRAISLKFDLPWAHGARGSAYMNKGEFDEAVASLTTAINQTPFARFLVDRSNCYLNTGNNPGAYDDATAAIEASPNYAIAYNNRAAALLNALRYGEARSDLDTALSIEPGNALYLANRAQANWGLGDARRAVQDAEDAVAADPESAYNFLIRAAAYELSDRLDEAMLDLDRAEDRGTKNVLYYLIRGNIRFKEQNLDGALADYDQAIALAPNWYLLYEQRGNCYSAMGRPGEAAQDLAYAQQLRGG